MRKTEHNFIFSNFFLVAHNTIILHHILSFCFERKHERSHTRRECEKKNGNGVKNAFMPPVAKTHSQSLALFGWQMQWSKNLPYPPLWYTYNEKLNGVKLKEPKCRKSERARARTHNKEFGTNCTFLRTMISFFENFTSVSAWPRNNYNDNNNNNNNYYRNYYILFGQVFSLTHQRRLEFKRHGEKRKKRHTECEHSKTKEREREKANQIQHS